VRLVEHIGLKKIEVKSRHLAGLIKKLPHFSNKQLRERGNFEFATRL
jgi:hypothetical protein